jgi:hypothetical protein
MNQTIKPLVPLLLDIDIDIDINIDDTTHYGQPKQRRQHFLLVYKRFLFRSEGSVDNNTWINLARTGNDSASAGLVS